MIAAVGLSLFTGCSYEDDIDPPNYVTFERDNSVDLGVEIDGSTTHEITVYTANIVGNDRSFDLEVSDASTLEASGYDVPASVTVPAGSNEATFTVEVSDVNLGLAGKNLFLHLSETSELSSGEAYQISVSRTCVGTEFVIDFEFDNWASEVEWSLEDANGNVLVTGGGYSDGLQTASRSLCLDQGTYTFTVTDAFGDGLTDPNGLITLSYAGEELVVIAGDYEDGTSVEVTF